MRAAGVGPALTAWKAAVIPLDHARKHLRAIKAWNIENLELWSSLSYSGRMSPPTRSLLSICALVALGVSLAYVSSIQNKNATNTTNNSNFANVVTGLDGTNASVVSRIANPYPTAPESAEEVERATRAALVNIFCQTTGGPIRPISGSGVIIDPRGVILTNAHIAQYVLLSEDSASKLTCSVRTGSPARATWQAAVLYIPDVWVDLHANELNNRNPLSTGEHDYALLAITKTVDGDPLPSDGFPYLPMDTRERIAFTDDSVLVGSYPAEFIAPSAAENSLLPSLSQSAVAQLLTFTTGSVDLISVNDVREAQSGSSGGAVVNAWARLVGLLVTTSDATTTANRTLHALTLSYVDRDMETHVGKNLSTFLAGDINATLNNFNATSLRPLLQQYSNFLN